ncbi:hypothetical protein F5Y17DRAFT_146265 [Xylariaceae sp. FL0594]|nr:hypothetical protein F5Y17DRAFT_146265 [Xylariaceae sp. FL0594]
MTRKNADTLVGLPDQRVYNASRGARYKPYPIERGKSRGLHYHSLFVDGFVFAKIGTLKPASQQGNIPNQWKALGTSEGTLTKEYLRTLVADRGANGRNAPRHYERLIRHAYTQGVEDETLNTERMVHFGKSKFVSEGANTPGRLGLVPQLARTGDLICILHGCSVPVVLREFTKTDQDMENEVVSHVAEIARNPLKRQLEKVRERMKARSTATNEGATTPTDAPANTSAGTQTDISASTPADTHEQTQTGRKRKRGPLPSNDQPQKTRNTRSAAKARRTGGATTSTDTAAKTSENTVANTSKKATAKFKGRKRKGGLLPSDDAQQEEARNTRPAAQASGGNNSTTTQPAIPNLEKPASTFGTRVTRNFYQLIGECYVDGIMNGEAVGTERARTRIFELR